MASIDYTGDVDNGFFSWIKSVFTLSDDKFMRKCGVDAVQYLTFQRHMIFLVAIMTVVCLAVILPINIQGTLQVRMKIRSDFLILLQLKLKFSQVL